MLRQLNDVNSEFHNYPYNVGVSGWKFNDKEYIIQGKVNTTLNGAISSGATSIVLTSSTGFDDPSGTGIAAGYIKTGTYDYDFFTYEGISTNTLTTVNDVSIDHATGQAVHKIYQLPSDFGKTRSLFRQSNVVEYVYIDQDLRQVPPYGFYMLKSLRSTNGHTRSFLVLPENIGAINFVLKYITKPTTISAKTDSVNAPDGMPRRFLIEKMNFYVWTILGEMDLALAANQRAQLAMTESLAQWTTHTVQTNSSISLYW